MTALRARVFYDASTAAGGETIREAKAIEATMRASLNLTSHLLFVALWSMACAPAIGADDGCGAFGWSVHREKGWLADSNLPRRPSGARLRRIDRAVTLELKPVKQVPFFLPPAQRPKAGTYAGEVTFFGVPKPGLYQVTLSEAADVDVFENGMRIKPAAVASASRCADARVSARFDLGTGDLVLVQVTNVASPFIKIAFAAAE